MPQEAVVESPTSTPASVGGSTGASTPASAPAGTSVSHGTASSALIAAAEAAMKAEGGTAESSPAGGAPAKTGADTSGSATPAGSAVASPEKQVPEGQQPPASGAEGARKPELEQQFQRVARNAQNKVLEALGFSGIRYEQIPALAKELKTAVEVLRDLRKDSKGFSARLTAHLAEESGESAFKMPEGQLTAEDGKTRVFSTEQLIKDVLPAFEKEITRKLLSNGALKNVISYVDEQSTRQATEATQRQNKETINGVLTEMRALPHFKENEQKIVSLIAAWHEADPAKLKSRGVAWAVNAAYNTVLNKDVYGDSYRATVEQEIRDGMKKKAAGGGGPDINPGSRGGDGMKVDIPNVDALAKHLERLASA